MPSYTSSSSESSSPSSSSQVWFPVRTSDLFEATKHTIEAGTHLEADHPGFHDSAYRKRRDELASIARAYNPDTDLIPVIEYTDNEIYCWSEVWNRMEPLWKKYACKQFLDGLEEMKRHCNYNKDEIPRLEVVSKYLQSKTNFVIKPVPGQLSSRTFLNGLAFRIFFCTQYVRHHSKPLYTPEPDICHELLGHAPMLTDHDFCDFSQEIGLASIGATDEEIVKLARCYWFSVEFGICKEEVGRCDESGTPPIKAYGAGLLSSFGELEHVLANDGYDKPVHEPWCPRKASNQEHPLTTYQPLYFLAGSVQQVKNSIREYCKNEISSPHLTRFDHESRSLFTSRPFEIQTMGSSAKATVLDQDDDPPPRTPPTDTAIWDTWMSQWHLPVVTVALELKLFDLIDEESLNGGMTLHRMAEHLSLRSSRALKALVVTLMAQRYLVQSPGKGTANEPRYKCTEASKAFFSQSRPDFYWGNMLAGADGSSERHRQLLDAIRNDGIIGAAKEWESGELSVERATELTSAFHSHSFLTALGAASAFHLNGTTHLLDVGGGSGCYSVAFVGKNKDIKATIMDLPAVCAVTDQKYFEETPREMKDRLHILPRDMFRDAWPTPSHGYDAVFMSNILHDWSYETCRDLLKKSYDTLPSGGKIILHEMLLDSGCLTAACFSIHMAVYTRGQQFYFDELKDMVEDVGFINVETVPSHGYYSIVHACKPDIN